MMMLDSQRREIAASRAVTDDAGHQPGYAQITDAERVRRQAMYERHDAALSERWKPRATANDATRPTGDSADTYALYDHRVSNAWRQR